MGLGVIGQIQQPLLLVGAERRLLWASQAAHRLFDLPMGGMAGRRVDEIADLPPESLDLLGRAMVARGPRSGTVNIVTRRARRCTIRFKAIELGDDVRLFTLSERARAVAVRASDTHTRRTSPSGRLAAALAHQIRTPLGAALMYLRLVEQEVGEQVSPPLRDGLTLVSAEILKLDRLLANLMDMHRLGHLVIRPTLVDGARVVGEAVSRALPQPTSAQVSVEIGAGDLTDWWDPSAVEQIVQTLISNAFKYGQGRPIAVNVDRVDASLRLRVSDSGVGIPAATHTRIFHGPPVAPKARTPGLGLGLWLVGRLAKAHGGSASVESRDGAGTTVTVTLNPQRPPAPPC